MICFCFLQNFRIVQCVLNKKKSSSETNLRMYVPRIYVMYVCFIYVIMYVYMYVLVAISFLGLIFA